MSDLILKLPDGRKLIAIDPTGLGNGDIIQYSDGSFIRIPRQASVDDVDRTNQPASNVDRSNLATDGYIGSLSISSTYDPAEIESLRDETEKLRDQVKTQADFIDNLRLAQIQSMDTIDALKNRLTASNGNGLIADAT